VPVRAASALGFPFAAPATDGSLVEVAPGVLWASMPMPMGLDHVNVWLLRGDSGWTTGRHRPAHRGHAARCGSASPPSTSDGLPVQALVCTHFHPDHAGLAAWLCERFDVPLYMSLRRVPDHARALADGLAGPAAPRAARVLPAGRPDGRARRSAVRAAASRPLHAAAAGRIPAAARRRPVLTIGARRWQVLIGEGHSPEHVCLYCAEERLLISGDQLLPRISSNVLVNANEPDGNPLALWFESLDRLDRCEPDTLVLPSHHEGLPRPARACAGAARAPPAAVRRRPQLLAGCDECTAVRGDEQQLFPRLRGEFDEMLALGETVAHLAWLLDAGELQRRLGPDGVYRYAITPAPHRPETHW
jgi:glyoxylase-like metal-dependent hydrolase (beta-lactamase superfamily II)